MVDAEKTVFLSYRREVSWAVAHLVRNDLMQHDFDVFMDTQNLDSGEFERVILREIEMREHFLVLLEPRSFDRIADDGDWLRREIAHALARQRNVVPVLANGARMPDADARRVAARTCGPTAEPPPESLERSGRGGPAGVGHELGRATAADSDDGPLGHAGELDTGARGTRLPGRGHDEKPLVPPAGDMGQLQPPRPFAAQH